MFKKAIEDMIKPYIATFKEWAKRFENVEKLTIENNEMLKKLLEQKQQLMNNTLVQRVIFFCIMALQLCRQ